MSVTSTGNIDAADGIVAISAPTAGGGNGGSVTVSSTGAITADNTAIVAISGQAGGALADSGDVTVTNDGAIVAATGIAAQSGAAVGDSGDVTITTAGNITASNTAISARAGVGAVTSGNIAIVINSGTVSSGTGPGVDIAGGVANSLTVNALAAITSTSGLAIRGGSGNETIDNSGTITGSVDLGAGVNTFNNQAGALFNAGPTINLGAGNSLTNGGTLAPGGAGTIQTTALTGNFTQTAAGAFAVDADGVSGTSDRLNVTGTASVAGTVVPHLTSVGSTKQFRILSAAGGTTDNGVTVADTLFVDYSLLFPNANDMVLATEVNFLPSFVLSGLNINQTAIANDFNALTQVSLPADLDGLLVAIANISTVADFRSALDALSPEVYLDGKIAALFSNLQFTDNMLSCHRRDGEYAFIREDQCVWVRAGGTRLQQDATDQMIGFRDKSWHISAGAQFSLSDRWLLATSVAYGNSSLDANTNAASDGDRVQAGVALKYSDGPFLFAAAVTGGYGWFDSSRPIAFPGFNALATADYNVGTVGGRLRAAYGFDFGNWYIKALVDLGATYVSLGAFTESGGGGANLSLERSGQWVFSASPAVEIGTEIRLAGDAAIRPYVRAGATFLSDNQLAVSAQFAGAPSSVPPFITRAFLDDALADLSAGVDFLGANGLTFRVSYGERFANSLHERSGSVKASWKF